MTHRRRLIAAAILLLAPFQGCSCAQNRQAIYPRGGNLFSRFRSGPKAERTVTDLPAVEVVEPTAPIDAPVAAKSGVPMLKP